MGFKGFFFIFVIFAIYLMHADAHPSSTKKEPLPTVKVIPKQVKIDSGIELPGRVTCPYKEATEDATCQKHCLPKGYSYGVCVSGTCSCI